MIYIDIELLSQPSVGDLAPLIQICPHHGDEGALDILAAARFFPGVSTANFEQRYQGFHREVVDWVLSACPDFDPAAVHFCTDHLVRHALVQYICAFDTAVEIARQHPAATVLCRDTLPVIQSDWNSVVFNLLGVLDGYASLGLDVQLAELGSGILADVLRNGFEYLPVGVLYRQLTDHADRGNFFVKAITDPDHLRYTLTGRYAEAINDTEGSVLNLLPKSAEIAPGRLGLANQFGGIQPEPLNFATAPRLGQGVENALSRRIETVFFASIGRELLGRLAVLEPRFHEAFAATGRLPRMVAEETVELESLALFSALKRIGAEITVTQHSYNPLLRSLKAERSGGSVVFPTRILASQKPSAELYRQCFGASVVVEERIAPASAWDGKQAPFTVFDRRRIVMIDNDFIRPFGVAMSLERLFSEVITFVGAARALGFTEFIWRQRTLQNTVFIDAVRQAFPGIEIELDARRSVADLAAQCFAAVGFGATSSLALQFICQGGIYRFASVVEDQLEYLPRRAFVGDAPGGVRVAADLAALVADAAGLQEFWCKQRTCLASDYGL